MIICRTLTDSPTYNMRPVGSMTIPQAALKVAEVPIPSLKPPELISPASVLTVPVERNITYYLLLYKK